MQQTFETVVGGKKLSIEVGRLAKQADGAAFCRYGDTVVLVTATMSDSPREGIDFFPLMVDYEERLYAVGKIPGGFIKREGRPSEAAILSGRMIDRPVRPLFPKGFRNDVQIVATVMSVEPGIEPGVLAMNGASLALSISQIPFAGPIGGVKVGRIDGKFVINPSVEEMERSDVSFVVAGTKDAILMVEGGANEISEVDALDAIMFAHEAIKEIIAFQEQIIAAVGKEKIEFHLEEPDHLLVEKIETYAKADLDSALRNADKTRREEMTQKVKEDVIARLVEEMGEEAPMKEIVDILSLHKTALAKETDNTFNDSCANNT